MPNWVRSIVLFYVGLNPSLMRRKMEFEAELQSILYYNIQIQMNVFPFPYPDEERKSALAIAYSGDGYAFHLVDYLGS